MRRAACITVSHTCVSSTQGPVVPIFQSLIIYKVTITDQFFVCTKFISNFHLDDTDVTPRADHQQQHCDHSLDHRRPPRPRPSQCPSIRPPPPLHSAFHKISAWKRPLNVTFIPGMKARFMAAWHPTRDKVKRREGINTEHEGRARLTVACPDEREGERKEMTRASVPRGGGGYQLIP